RVPSAVTPPVTETVKAVPVATPVERLDTTPAVAKTAIAMPAVPPVEHPERVPSAVTPPVTETIKAVPVAAAVERLDTTPVVAKTAIATPAVPPVERVDLAPMEITTPVAAAVERSDSALPVAKMPAATFVIPPVDRLNQAPMAVITPVAETVSGLATVTMAMPVADMAKKVSAGQQDRTPVRLDAPSMTLSSAISASTATEVTAVAGAEIDAALQDNVAPKPSASQTMGGRPFQPRLADPFNVIEPVATVETDSAVQVLAGEAQPVSVPVTTTGPSTTRSDPSATSTIHNSLSLVTAAAPIRPQSVHGVDAENPQLEKLSAEPVVIRAAEPTAPASGSAITPPASVASVASSRPEAVTTPTFTQTTSDTLDLQQSNWGRTLGHQLNWMINSRVQEAQIRVNPPDLGPIEVRMSMQQNHTNVTFLCHEAAVREAIENALPRLREMLNSQGILLNQAQVSDQSLARQQSGFGEQPYSRRESGSETATPDRNPAADTGEPPLRPRRSLGMVDHYV
ncbi:flagellar hook-length control protein FliK, partial [Candidatus Contendibacter odensensis]|uniref:flagellar hook-length control protein FliK n=1 Tax=Candidatus Contendibacter odensensis TaxID=1400860 RepID=UPI0012B6A9E5